MSHHFPNSYYDSDEGPQDFGPLDRTSIEVVMNRAGEATCPTCKGSGILLPNMRHKAQGCTHCMGSGVVFGGVDVYDWPSFYGLSWKDVEGPTDPGWTHPSDDPDLRDPLEDL